MCRVRFGSHEIVALGLAWLFSSLPAMAEIRALELGLNPAPTGLVTTAMQAFPLDTRPLFEEVTSIPGPTGDIQLPIPLQHRRVGMGWSRWGRGYEGDVYFTGGAEITLVLPPNSYALTGFVGYGAGTFTYTLSTPAGQHLSQSGYGRDGAYGFILWSDTDPIPSVTIRSWGTIAIGELQIGTTPVLNRLYVDGDAPPGNTGASWDDALSDLRTALNGTLPGTEIRIAAGTYRPGTTRTASFQVRGNATVRGGFAGRGHPNPDETGSGYLTVLSGDLLGNDEAGSSSSRDDNAYHVLQIAGPLPAFSPSQRIITLRDLIIRGGNANNPGAVEDLRGGGAWVRTHIVMIDYCTFEDCTAGSDAVNGLGGAIFDENTGGLTLRNCVFQRNRAARGGAIASTSLSPYGNTRIEDSRFSENQAHAWGGAIYAEGNLRIGLYRTGFSRNFAIEGGALWPPIWVISAPTDAPGIEMRRAAAGPSCFSGLCCRRFQRRSGV